MLDRGRDLATGQGRGSVLRVAAAVSMIAALVGCASPGTNLVECPLSLEQQQQAVLEVVPRGSTRAEAEHRLQEAGIEFSPGQKNSIYYLSLWNRPNGQRWHINVALLFDGQGKLYQSRGGDSGIGPLTGEAAAGSRTPDRARTAGGSFPAAVDAGGARDDDNQKHVPFPDQHETGKGAR